MVICAIFAFGAHLLRRAIGLVARLAQRLFFFSSRRRHTRCGHDWSSDVCSSDLGPVAVQTIQSLHVDCLFMGVHGIDPGAGFTSPNLVEAETNRAMVAATRRLVVLADHTKCGVVGLSTIASLDEASVLITDSGLEPEAREALTGRVGELTLVEPAQIGLLKVPPLDAAGVSA